MHSFPRSNETRLYSPRETLDRECSGCGSVRAAAYRVLSEGGWWDVVKCQDCLKSLERVRAPRLGVFRPMVGATLMEGPPEGFKHHESDHKEAADVRS